MDVGSWFRRPGFATTATAAGSSGVFFGDSKFSGVVASEDLAARRRRAQKLKLGLFAGGLCVLFLVLVGLAVGIGVGVVKSGSGNGE